MSMATAHRSSELEQAITRAAELISNARHTVALVGAGLSAESGIPTFRGPDGLWTRIGEPTIDGWDLFRRDPRAWWEQALSPQPERKAFAEAIAAAAPNPGHFALADLEHMGKLAHVITQNVDDLHRQAGSLCLTEIHGNRTRVRCMNCSLREPLENISLERLPPACPECGGVMKNDTVMFGEPIPQDALIECERQTARADLFLTIGTSAVVYPAAMFPQMAKRRGAPLIEINPNETDLSYLADVIVRAPSGEALPEIVKRVRA
jgi:NAD-dependent deacetylase